MAPKNGKNPTKLKMPALPKGWKEASSTLAGWFCRKPGNMIIGTLRGSFEVDDKFNRGKKRKVYRIEVVEGNPLIGAEDSGEVANPGDIIGLDETGYTRKLGDYEQGQAVLVRYVGKQGEGREDPHVFQVATPED